MTQGDPSAGEIGRLVPRRIRGDAVPIKVLVAEPDEILNIVIARCLADPEFAPHTTDARDPGELTAVANQLGVQVVVAGPTYPHEALLKAIPRLLSQGARTLVVSSSALDDRTSLLLLAGASGFLIMNDASIEAVSSAVQTVASGESALHPTVVHAVLERWRASRVPDERAAAANTGTSELTGRERDVLAGLRDGLTNRQLAARLGVAEKTVETHKARLYAKLGARNQAHAVRVANDRGLH